MKLNKAKETLKSGDHKKDLHTEEEWIKKTVRDTKNKRKTSYKEHQYSSTRNIRRKDEKGRTVRLSRGKINNKSSKFDLIEARTGKRERKMKKNMSTRHRYRKVLRLNKS